MFQLNEDRHSHSKKKWKQNVTFVKTVKLRSILDVNRILNYFIKMPVEVYQCLHHNPTFVFNSILTLFVYFSCKLFIYF